MHGTNPQAWCASFLIGKRTGGNKSAAPFKSNNHRRVRGVVFCRVQSGITDGKKLPQGAKDYIKFIEQHASVRGDNTPLAISRDQCAGAPRLYRVMGHVRVPTAFVCARFVCDRAPEDHELILVCWPTVCAVLLSPWPCSPMGRCRAEAGAVASVMLIPVATSCCI